MAFWSGGLPFEETKGDIIEEKDEVSNVEIFEVVTNEKQEGICLTQHFMKITLQSLKKESLY